MTEFIADNISLRLKKAASGSKRPARVAVAYFGQGAAKLLPLPKGSWLVVDASEHSVKSGQTCPAELKSLSKKGVKVFSVQNLHAKVFVIGTTAFIGSANVSRHSANTLVEAMVALTDAKTVRAARQFVKSLCLQELGPEELDRLQKMYKPPRFAGGGGIEPGRVLKKTFITQLDWVDSPEGSERTEEAGMKIARKKMDKPRSHVLDDLWWPGNSRFKAGDVLIQVVDEGNGRKMVYPPANVISTTKWNGTKPCTFVYLELPNRKRVNLDRLAKQVGWGAKKQLSRDGVIKRDFLERLLTKWKA